MVNIEQARRLAVNNSYPQSIRSSKMMIKYDEYGDLEYVSSKRLETNEVTGMINSPDEGEMMEYLKRKDLNLLESYIRHWLRHAIIFDITEVLVRCCEEIGNRGKS